MTPLALRVPWSPNAMAIYHMDVKAFGRASGAYAAKRSELDQAEHDWLELEILREAVEGAGG